ncbi:MAG: tetratricopeptide repeat protein [Planctomycetaceae bacterium]|nr:tetratricopeptide repeat protein [Planctomycetaceae bacterium]
MNTKRPVPQVNSGIPWWLWGMMFIATIAVILGVVISLTPDDPEQRFEEARKAVESRDDDAFGAAMASLKKNPAYADHVVFLEGIHAASKSRDPLALELFEQIRDNEQLRPDVLRQTGLCQARIGQFQEAIATYEEAIKLDPVSAGEARLLLAQMYYNIGALKLAENTLDDAVSANPDDNAALTLRGSIKADLRRFSEALDDLNQVMDTPGERAAASPDVLLNYGLCLLKTNNKEAIRELVDEQARSITDTDLRGQLLLAVDEVEGAGEIAIEEQTPDSAVSRLQVRVENVKGETDKAVQHIKTLIPQFPRDVEIHEIAAETFKAAGDEANLAAAQKVVDQLNDLTARFTEAVLNISDDIDDIDGRIECAKLAWELGRFNDAGRWLRVAVTLDKGEKHKDRIQEAGQSISNFPPPLAEYPFLTTSGGKAASDENSKTAVDSEPPKATSEDSGATTEASGSEKPSGNGNAAPKESPPEQPAAQPSSPDAQETPADGNDSAKPEEKPSAADESETAPESKKESAEAEPTA